MSPSAWRAVPRKLRNACTGLPISATTMLAWSAWATRLRTFRSPSSARSAPSIRHSQRPAVPAVQHFSGAEALHGRYWTLPETLSTTSSDVAADESLPEADAMNQVGTGPNTGVAFGVPSSHGCPGVQVDDAAWQYS